MISLCNIIQGHAIHLCTYLLINTTRDKQKWMWRWQIINAQEGIINGKENVQDFMLAITWWWRSLSAGLKQYLASRIRTSDRWITIDSIYSPPLYQLSYREMPPSKIYLIIILFYIIHIIPFSFSFIYLWLCSLPK